MSSLYNIDETASPVNPFSGWDDTRPTSESTAGAVLDFIFNRPIYEGLFVEIETGVNPLPGQRLIPDLNKYIPVENLPAELWQVYETWGLRHLWVGALPRSTNTRLLPKESARNEDLDTLATIYTDLDGKDRNPADPAAGKAALATIIQSLPPTLQPTLVVDSGGGYHCWWSLNQGIFSDDWDQLIRALYLAIAGQNAGEVGYESAHDARRILRLPASTNYKHAYGPTGRPVRIVAFNPVIHDPMQLLDTATETAGKTIPRANKMSNSRKTDSKTAEIVKLLNEGAPVGQRHAAVNMIVGKLHWHRVPQEMIHAIMGIWWEHRELETGLATADDTEQFALQMADVLPRWERPPVVAAAELTEGEINQILGDYPGLRINPFPALREARADGVPPGHLVTVLNVLGQEGEAMVERLLAQEGATPWH